MEGFTQYRQGKVAVHPLRILITRPEPAASRFAAALAARFAGVVSVIAPLQRIEFTGDCDGQGADAFIFTSANGVAGFSGAAENRRAYCVGPATTKAARDAGFDAVQAGQDADTLIATLSQSKPDGRILHPRGEHGRGQVAERLVSAGLAVAECVAYRQVSMEIDPDLAESLGSNGAVIVPLFSPRSARLASAALQKTGGRYALATMSPAVTDAWGGPAPIALQQAVNPDQEAMLDAVELLIDAVQRLEGRGTAS